MRDARNNNLNSDTLLSYRSNHVQFKVEELVNYGLAGAKAPSINMTGEHLEPKDYHEKMAEGNTVIIDVRNHYGKLCNLSSAVPLKYFI